MYVATQVYDLPWITQVVPLGLYSVFYWAGLGVEIFKVSSCAFVRRKIAHSSDCTGIWGLLGLAVYGMLECRRITLSPQFIDPNQAFVGFGLLMERGLGAVSLITIVLLASRFLRKIQGE